MVHTPTPNFAKNAKFRIGHPSAVSVETALSQNPHPFRIGASRQRCRATRRANPSHPGSAPSKTSDAPAFSSTRLAMASLALRKVDVARAGSRLVGGLVGLWSGSRACGTRSSRSPSTRNTAPAGPSASRSVTLPPAGCPSIMVAIRYCKASRSRDSGAGSVAVHVPTSRSRISRTAAIDDRSSITLCSAGVRADEYAFDSSGSTSRYSRINWIMPITFSVCCRAAATLSCCCSATSSMESSSGSCSESSSEQRRPVSGWLNECSNSPSTSGPRRLGGKECGLAVMPPSLPSLSDTQPRERCESGAERSRDPPFAAGS